MGIVEDLWEHVSILSASRGLWFAVIAYVLYRVYVGVDKHYRLKRLGARAPRIRHKLPFGKWFILVETSVPLTHI